MLHVILPQSKIAGCFILFIRQQVCFALNSEQNNVLKCNLLFDLVLLKRTVMKYVCMLHIYIYIRYGKRRKRKFGTGSWTRSFQGPSLNCPEVCLRWFTNPGCHRETELMSHFCIKV